MYTIDRLRGAKILGISTRTLDRYIRKGKVRSQKTGKKVYLNEEDIQILKNGGIQEDYEIINNNFDTAISKRSSGENYRELYENSQKIIEKKDELIQELSYKLGNAESELKNSVSLLEYKKATFLLESSRTKIEEEKLDLRSNIEKLTQSLKSQEMANIVLIIVSFFVIIGAFFVWFANI